MEELPKEEDNNEPEIETAIEEEKKSSSSKGVIIMVAILVVIFAGFMGGSYIYNGMTGAVIVNIDDLHEQNLNEELEGEEGLIYNGYSFVKADGLWWTQVNKFGTLLKFPLHFNPKQVEDVEVTGKLNDQFNYGNQVFVTISPKVEGEFYSLAVSELSFNIVQGFERIPVGSCTEEHWACENRTIVSCDNNPNNLPVVEFSYGEEKPKVELLGNCIRLSGTGYDLTRAANRLIYQWYNIME